MTNLPPPPPPPPSSSPGGFGAPLPFATSPPPKRNGKAIAGLVGAIVLVAGLAAGGTYLATRGDDDGESADRTEVTDETREDRSETTDETDPTETSSASAESSAPTLSPIATAAPTTTIAPATTVPATTVPATTVPAPTTTAPFVVPAGSIDLGFQVYIPMPEGWERSGEDPVTLTNGPLSLTIQALQRDPGQDPAIVIQEYVDLFDADFDAITYQPSEHNDIEDGVVEIDQHSVYYRTYAADDGLGLEGGIHTFLRGDGLTVVYDIFGDTTQTMGLPDSVFDTFLLSLQQAPAVAEPVALPNREPFRVTTVHPAAQVDGFIGFTPAPGFTVSTSGDGYAAATNGTVDFEVSKATGLANVDDASRAAEAFVLLTNVDVEFQALTADPPNDSGVSHQGRSWVGTFEDGNPVAGTFDVFHDPATGNAVAILRSWYTEGDNVLNPFPAEVEFMFVSAITSFTTIP